MNFIDNSTILIVNDIESTLNELLPNYPMHSTRIIKNEEKEEFLLLDSVEMVMGIVSSALSNYNIKIDIDVDENIKVKTS